MKIAITGKPGCGKTTLIKSASEFLKSLKVPVWGFYTEEVREGKRRAGFDLVDVKSGRRLPLARVGKGKFTVGKYRVEVENIKPFLRPQEGMLILDEVGKMELLSRDFRDFLEKILRGEGKVLLTYGLKIPGELRRRIEGEFEIFHLTVENRDEVRGRIFERLSHEFADKKD